MNLVEEKEKIEELFYFLDIEASFSTSVMTPITKVGEEEEEEELECDTSWMEEYSKRKLMEIEDTNDGEREMMTMWNDHITSYPYQSIGFRGLEQVLREFVPKISSALRSNDRLMGNFLLHLSNMVQGGLITQRTVRATQTLLQESETPPSPSQFLDEEDNNENSFVEEIGSEPPAICLSNNNINDVEDQNHDETPEKVLRRSSRKKKLQHTCERLSGRLNVPPTTKLLRGAARIPGPPGLRDRSARHLLHGRGGQNKR